MEWYAPLTILPAIGLIIMSTSGFIVALNNELTQLEQLKEKNIPIIREKLKQLKRLGVANACLYGSALIFLLSGLSKAIFQHEYIFKMMMIIAVIFTTIALFFLCIHSIKAIQVRQKNLDV
ncbi:hypothetical protein [Sediminitomix flava]|uniref:DUF2721 domain-containing protein n=1 Tax=Sediminitomix flava TaxID=379075 RepID=A0A315Z784_SEDFL|nr:hypothetical protein [Sediminitomix flava]PWJ38635.1 hypothetical protein BC781_107226 [Sediminitomix flava]